MTFQPFTVPSRQKSYLQDFLDPFEYVCSSVEEKFQDFLEILERLLHNI